MMWVVGRGMVRDGWRRAGAAGVFVGFSYGVSAYVADNTLQVKPRCIHLDTRMHSVPSEESSRDRGAEDGPHVP